MRGFARNISTRRPGSGLLGARAPGPENAPQALEDKEATTFEKKRKLQEAAADKQLSRFKRARWPGLSIRNEGNGGRTFELSFDSLSSSIRFQAHQWARVASHESSPGQRGVRGRGGRPKPEIASGTARDRPVAEGSRRVADRRNRADVKEGEAKGHKVM